MPPRYRAPMDETRRLMEARRRKILTLVDPARERGLEIGALTSPVVERTAGSILYADRLSAEGLAQQYAWEGETGELSLPDLVEVDVVVPDGDSLARSLAGRGPVDYVVASHVIEHVPDIVGWLVDVAACLREGGHLCLAVPDKRFTFDHLRAPTEARDLVERALTRPRYPTPGQIFDHVDRLAEVDPVALWRGQDGARRARETASARALAMEMATTAAIAPSYPDIHCSVFTPASFCRVMGEVMGLGLVPFAFADIQPTETYATEFYATLRKREGWSAQMRGWSAPRLDPARHDRMPKAELPASSLRVPDVAATDRTATGARDPTGRAQDRRSRILSLVDPARESGLEIGPLASPVVPRATGRILYSDHRSTEELRRQYGPHAAAGAVDLAQIVEIDVVVPETTTIAAVLGTRGPVDYVVASHVIEHVPNVVGWLNEIAECLREGGHLCLAVPDKRFTFDHFRATTAARDLVEWHFAKPQAPTPGQVYDHVAHVAHIDPGQVWTGRPVTRRALPGHDPAEGLRIARGVTDHGGYNDVHCTVFTPASFALAIGEVIALGLVPFAFAALRPTDAGEMEFFATLRKDQSSSPEERAAATPVLDPVRHDAFPAAPRGWRARLNRALARR